MAPAVRGASRLRAITMLLERKLKRYIPGLKPMQEFPKNTTDK